MDWFLDWVLFDPLKGFPREFGDPPSFFQRLATYSPNNTRILEYNVVSKSIRTRLTPRELLGCSVEYSKQGPKIIGGGSIMVASKQMMPSSSMQPHSDRAHETEKMNKKPRVCKAGSDVSDTSGLSETSVSFSAEGISTGLVPND